MSSGSYLQVHVGCPFYQHDDGKRVVTCEGLVPDADTKLRFSSRRKREEHMDRYCCGSYICCELYRALMQNYDEED